LLSQDRGKNPFEKCRHLKRKKNLNELDAKAEKGTQKKTGKEGTEVAKEKKKHLSIFKAGRTVGLCVDHIRRSNPRKED